MTPDQILDKYPQLGKITPEVISKVVLELTGEICNFNKTFAEMGIDDLDSVEMVMNIERKLNIAIPDDIAEYLFFPNVKPPNFIQLVRDRKIDVILS